MRDIHKTVTLPMGGEDSTFRLRKLDAFSGAKLLRALSQAQEEASPESPLTLTDLLFSLPEEELERTERACLAHAELELPAGPIPVFRDGVWGLPELEYETETCLKLTLEVMSWTLAGFFRESARPGSPEARTTSR